MSNKRIIVINHEKCKPKTPTFDYLVSKSKVCGKNCITKEDKKIIVSEEACMVCFNLAKRAPGDAVKVVNLPSNLSTEAVFRYSANSFKLHGIPIPKARKVLGLLGVNGIGKSTALKLLTGELIPNFEKYDPIPTKKDVLKHYRGNEIQKYLTQLYGNKIKISVKPQNINKYTKSHKNTTVENFLEMVDHPCIEKLELTHLMLQKIGNLSGGELQRVIIAKTCLKEAQIYFFDEPSSFLDVKQRIVASECIRKLTEENKYVVVVEHDLSILDYLSDYIQVIYGMPGVYGVITKPSMVSNAINQFINGYILNDNIRFRSYGLNFKTSTEDVKVISKLGMSYPSLKHSYPGFTLQVSPGVFNFGEVTCLLGQNGCGKTTFMKLLVKYFANSAKNNFAVSFKKQQLKLNHPGTVQDMMEEQINSALCDRFFRLFVLKPLQINKIKKLKVNSLSGGEMQKLAIVLCLGTSASVYLLDEPSAGLDCEQRLIVAKVIRKWIVNHLGKTCFLIEHDFLISTSIADRIIVYQGIPGVNTIASQPMALKIGFNKFLKDLNVSFRNDPENSRPRINKLNSVKDREQKSRNEFFLSS